MEKKQEVMGNSEKYCVGDTIKYKGFDVCVCKVNDCKVYFKSPIGKNMICIRAENIYKEPTELLAQDNVMTDKSYSSNDLANKDVDELKSQINELKTQLSDCKEKLHYFSMEFDKLKSKANLPNEDIKWCRDKIKENNDKIHRFFSKFLRHSHTTYLDSTTSSPLVDYFDI